MIEQKYQKIKHLTKEEAIQKMFDNVFQKCPSGICPLCSHILLQGSTVTEKTPVLTKCDFCGGVFE